MPTVIGQLRASRGRAFFNFTVPRTGRGAVSVSKPVALPMKLHDQWPPEVTAAAELEVRDVPSARLRLTRDGWALGPGEDHVLVRVRANGHTLHPFLGREAAFGWLATTVARCSPPIEPGAPRAATLRASDLGLVQRVADYRDAANRDRYLHMYAGKTIASWRAARAALDWSPRSPGEELISVGAGPGLDLVGWCFDKRWRGRVRAVDPVDWTVFESVPWRFALEELIGGRVTREVGVYAPPGPRPPQLDALGPLRPLPDGAVPDRSTLLLPFMVNHLHGGEGSPWVVALAAWLEAARRRGCRIALSDAHADGAPVWGPLLCALGVRTKPEPFGFAQLLDRLAGLYAPQDRRYRSGGGNPRFTRVRLLAGDERGWYFVPTPAGTR